MTMRRPPTWHQSNAIIVLLFSRNSFGDVQTWWRFKSIDDRKCRGHTFEWAIKRFCYVFRCFFVLSKHLYRCSNSKRIDLAFVNDCLWSHSFETEQTEFTHVPMSKWKVIIFRLESPILSSQACQHRCRRHHAIANCQLITTKSKLIAFDCCNSGRFFSHVVASVPLAPHQSVS